MDRIRPHRRFACEIPDAGEGPQGILVTIVLGIVGAVVGGYLGTLLGLGDLSGFDLWSMALAVGGGIVVLLLYGLATKGRS